MVIPLVQPRRGEGETATSVHAWLRWSRATTSSQSWGRIHRAITPGTRPSRDNHSACSGLSFPLALLASMNNSLPTPFSSRQHTKSGHPFGLCSSVQFLWTRQPHSCASAMTLLVKASSEMARSKTSLGVSVIVDLLQVLPPSPPSSQLRPSSTPNITLASQKGYHPRQDASGRALFAWESPRALEVSQASSISSTQNHTPSSCFTAVCLFTRWPL